MALAPAILKLISSAASSKRVQDIAGDLASKAYGRMFGETQTPALPQPGTPTDDPLEALRNEIHERPTRDEFVASFALLEAKFAIEQEKSTKHLRVVIAGQFIIVLLLVVVLIR